MFSQAMINAFLTGIWETLYMTLVSTFFAYLLGLPLGMLLIASDKGGVYPMPRVNAVLGFITNVVRSVPFIIAIVVLIPVTRAIIGTSLGYKATVVPLIIAATPFVARMVESSLKEVPAGVIDAAHSMGATPLQIVLRVMLPEATPSLLVGSAIAMATILSYTALAGAVGGGGLGSIAINYGYYRYNTPVMLVTLVLIVIIVQVLQTIAMRVARVVDRRLKD